MIISFFKHKIPPLTWFSARKISGNSCLLLILCRLLGVIAARLALYFYLSKTFNLVDQKLNSYGMSTLLCTLVHDYLTNRHNFVRVLGHLFRLVTLSSVPQGLILKPILFNGFINELSSCVRHSEIRQYANDIKLFRQILFAEDSMKLVDA